MEGLVKRAKSGDRQALSDLCERYHPILCRYLYALSRSRPLAEDLAQETLMAMLNNLEKYVRLPGGGFEGWLMRIARNKFLSEARSRRPEPLPERYDPPDPGPSPEAALIGREERAALEKALDALDGELREMVIMRYELDMSYRDIAQAMGVGGAKVKWRLHDALGKLRRAMEREGAS